MAAALQGLPELLRTLDRLGSQVGGATAPALMEEGERIMTDSKQNYVPVDQGVLRASGYVELHEQAGKVWVELGYGGAASDYALVQHERLDFKHPGGGQPKYLERPMMAAERGMTERLARGLWAAIERLIR